MPNSSTISEKRLFIPVSIEDTAITVVVPTIIPKIANEERHMTPGEMKKREKIAKSMKPVSDWEKRYPGRGKEVMYATATSRAMKEEIEVKEKSHAARIKELVKKKGRSMKENNVNGGKTMTGQSKDQVDMEPVHKDGIMSGAGVKSGA